MNDSILNIDVSCFENCKATVPKSVNLLKWLTSDKHRDKVEQIRSLQDEELHKKIKATLPAITPSGIFGYRSETHLIDHSGFLAFDIDLKDNTHISNFEELQKHISNIRSVAYCGLSVRGRGYWGLIPVPKSTPEIHKKRFASLVKDFAEFGIKLDPSGSDVCRLRFYSYDPGAYFNHTAMLYTKISQLKQERTTSRRPAVSDTRDRVEAVIALIREQQADITTNYDDWLRVGAALANEFGVGGRSYFHAVSQFHPDYNVLETDKKFDACLGDRLSRISIATFFHIAEKHGVSCRDAIKSFYDTLSGNLSEGDVQRQVLSTERGVQQGVPNNQSSPPVKNVRMRIEAIIDQLVQSQIDISQDFDEWTSIGSLLANEFGEAGRGYFHTVSQFHPWYSIIVTNYVYNQCLTGDYEKVPIGSFYSIVSKYGVKLHESIRN